jgi:Acetyltransferase (GNAT) domain
MAQPVNIQYLAQEQIDKKKWDACIDKAANGLIYAYSFYLDRMSRHWDALVLNDYEAVMPLTWNKKYGFKYLYQPFLTAQLGVFGTNLTEMRIADFVKAIPFTFKLIEISFNSGNIFSVPPGFVMIRNNYVLDLNKPYEELYHAYGENIRRNIKKAALAGCTLKKGFEAGKVIALAVQQMRKTGKEANENVERFRQLYQYLHDKQMATTYGIWLNDELVASCVFFFSHNRAYYILVGNHPNGRTIGASHALIDAFIKDHAGQPMLLDFEGSDIRNLAFFYSSFGARQEIYPAIKINRLPFYLKWLKN